MRKKHFTAAQLTTLKTVNDQFSTPRKNAVTSGLNGRARVIAIVQSKILLFLIFSFSVSAADVDINKNWRSIAISGYDTVAYFTMGEAVKGKSKYEHTWNDARWRFSTKEHLAIFIANPEKYAPRFGGYCAEGMAIGRKASIDPLAWIIVDDELYLNYSTEARDKMAANPKDTIQKANGFWERIQQRLNAF